MAMNINNLTGNRVGQLDSGRIGDKNSTENTSKKTASGSAPAQDSVVLTSEAQNLNRIQQGLLGDAESRSERVEGIKQAVADGSYQVNAEQVAKKMGDFEGELNQIFS